MPSSHNHKFTLKQTNSKLTKRTILNNNRISTKNHKIFCFFHVFNNNIGTIYVERVDATNSSGTLTYTTGISGTQGTPNADGTENDTQNIVVNTNSATLNINGAGGVDKFNIEASSFTKSLTIAGNLGTVPDHQEVLGNYDTVRIDLSKTSGVNLDISKLLVSNPNNEGIIITSSKGADNITLVAGANHDVIEFKAGGGLAAQQEEYTVELGNLRLAAGQSFTIDGLTITNVTGFANGGSPTPASTAAVLTADDIAVALQTYLKNAGYANASAAGQTITTSSAISKWVRIDGSIESLTTKNGWLDATGKADVSVGANGTSLVFTNANNANVTDLNFSFGGNDRTNGLGAEANKTQAFTAGADAVPEVTSGNVTFTDAAAKITDGASSSYTVSINGDDYTLIFSATGADASAVVTNAQIVNALTGAALGIANLNVTIKDSSDADVTSNITSIIPSSWTLTADTAQFKVSGLAEGESIGIGSSTVEYTPPVEAVQGQLTLDFGSGLLAGQSYTYIDKTVIATKDLTGEEVAEAFAFGVENNSGVDGAVVLGEWGGIIWNAAGTSTGTTAGIDPSKLLFDISGSSLILMEQTPGSAQGLKIAGFTTTPTLKGTGTLAVRTDKVTGETTQQGEKDTQIAADSYVTFAVLEAGSAGSGTDTGVATKIAATTNALDTITNFDVSNDKLALQTVSGGALSFTTGGSITLTESIYVDTAGSTLTVNNAGGMVSFGVAAASGATTTAEAITLDQKLYAAVNNVGDGAVVGFEHGGDTYVILGDANTGASTADLVIKLAGVTGVTDITSILA